jgi:hypothetical protein
MSVSVRVTIALVNVTATSYPSRRGFSRFVRRPDFILRRSGLTLLFCCSLLWASRLVRIPGKTPVSPCPVTGFVLSLLNLGYPPLKRIYFETADFFKGSPTASAWRMESFMEPYKLINEMYRLSLLLLLFALQERACCTPIDTEQ